MPAHTPEKIKEVRIALAEILLYDMSKRLGPFDYDILTLQFLALYIQKHYRRFLLDNLPLMPDKTFNSSKPNSFIHDTLLTLINQEYLTVIPIAVPMTVRMFSFDYRGEIITSGNYINVSIFNPLIAIRHPDFWVTARIDQIRNELNLLDMHFQQGMESNQILTNGTLASPLTRKTYKEQIRQAVDEGKFITVNELNIPISDPIMCRLKLLELQRNHRISFKDRIVYNLTSMNERSATVFELLLAQNPTLVERAYARDRLYIEENLAHFNHKYANYTWSKLKNVFRIKTLLEDGCMVCPVTLNYLTFDFNPIKYKELGECKESVSLFKHQSITEVIVQREVNILNWKRGYRGQPFPNRVYLKFPPTFSWSQWNRFWGLNYMPDDPRRNIICPELEAQVDPAEEYEDLEDINELTSLKNSLQ